MGVFSRIMDRIRFNAKEEDEGYFLDDDYEEEDDEQESFTPRKTAPVAAPSSPLRNIVGRNKVVPIQNSQDTEVTLIKPVAMDDSKTICDYLLAGKAVVLNMEGLNTDPAQRFIDFTLGAIYSIDGDLQMISRYIFIASPRNVSLSGDFASNFQNMVSSKAVSSGTFGSMNFNV